jgi:hypothetical protein
LAPKENWFTPGVILGWTDVFVLVLGWAGQGAKSYMCACYVFDCVAFTTRLLHSQVKSTARRTQQEISSFLVTNSQGRQGAFIM